MGRKIDTDEPLLPEQPEPLPEMGHARIRATKPLRIVDVARQAIGAWLDELTDSLAKRKRTRR